MNILFMCVANSARSQMAEGLAKAEFPDAVVMSAGSIPSKVNPFAVQAMEEVGIDISKQYSKSLNELPLSFVAQVDYIITLCSEEVCPAIASQSAQKLCWAMPDPATKDTLEDQAHLQRFRTARETLLGNLKGFKATIMG